MAGDNKNVNVEAEMNEAYLHGRKGNVIQIKPGQAPPPGAVLINREMVTDMKHKALLNRPLSESWAFRYGSTAIVASSWLSGAVVSYTMRRKLKVFQPTGRALSYLFCVVGPCVISGLCHEIVRKKVLSNEKSCPVCLPLKSSCINLFTGWLVPSALAFITAAHVARQNHTYPVPRLNEWKALVQVLNKLSYRYRPLYGATLCLSAILPFVLTYAQGVEARNIVLEKHVGYEDQITSLSNVWGDASVNSSR